MDEDLPYWLALSRRPWSGCRGLAALAAGRIGVRELLGGTLRRAEWRAVERDLAWLERPGHHLVALTGPLYPGRLREIADPPPALFVRGHPEVLACVQLAVVGSRRATPGGRETAFALARELARGGVAVTSGLAAGIDAAGHRGALAAGGVTLAVAGHGLDRIYPPRHAELACEIVERGALVSEFAPGTAPRAMNFPRRNRVISGLSLGVLVVEAAERSGSLITARLAGEQGREVFAVPGSVHSPLSRGCHRLIREGAKLVECVDDVLEELPELADRARVAPGAGERVAPCAERSREHACVLRAIGYEPTVFDLIVQRSGLTTESVSSILLALELGGDVACVPGGAYVRTAQDGTRGAAHRR